MKTIFSLSGGKDSTIALWLAIENNYPINVVLCAKLPFEEPEMEEHLNKLDRYVLEKLGFGITFVSNPNPIEPFMSERIKRGKHKGIIRGFPLSYSFCWISRDWKINLLKKFEKEYNKKHNEDVYIYKGFAIDEKNPLRKLKVNNYKLGIFKFQRKNKEIDITKEIYPLVDFNYTEEMCRAKLKEIGLDSPVHFMSNRSGCWFCPKAKKEIRLKGISRFPDRIKKIRTWHKISQREIYADLKIEEIEKCIK